MQEYFQEILTFFQIQVHYICTRVQWIQMPITIKDIAKISGVSHSTVSRALHGNPLIAESTANRIRQTALDLGYLPSVAARSLKTNRSQALGVILSSVDDPFFGEILQGIEEVAQNSGYSLFIAASQSDPHRERNIVQAMREHSVDGVILCSASFSNAQSSQFPKFGIPIVVVNNQSAEDYRYAIYHDDMDGSRQVTRHLISIGHCKIAYLGNALSGRTGADRVTGYKNEMKAAGLPILPGYIHKVAGGSPLQGAAGLRHFLGLNPRPTAYVCFNDMIAIGLLQALQQSGITVPGECSVVGFDNIQFSAYTNPPLTTFDQPKRHLGEEAARLILGLLATNLAASPNPAPKIQVLRGSLLVRGSTASPLKD